MRTLISPTVALALVSSISLFGFGSTFAQSSKGRQSPSTQMTITGCLRSSAAGASKTNPQPVVYTLDVAAPGQSSGTTTSSAPAPRKEAKAAAQPRPATYTLMAPVEVNLAAHVNHRVELTGHVREGAATSTGTAGRPSPEVPEAADPTAAASNRTFDVQALRMISATCPSK